MHIPPNAIRDVVVFQSVIGGVVILFLVVVFTFFRPDLERFAAPPATAAEDSDIMSLTTKPTEEASEKGTCSGQTDTVTEGESTRFRVTVTITMKEKRGCAYALRQAKELCTLLQSAPSVRAAKLKSLRMAVWDDKAQEKFVEVDCEQHEPGQTTPQR